MSARSFDEYIEKSTKMWMILNRYQIEVGVFSKDSNRKETAIVKDITNAELMFIHENGSALQNIPARPVLEMSIKYAIKKIVPVYLNDIEKEILNDTATVDKIENMLEKMCLRIQNYAQDLIYKNDGRLAKNAPSTIKRKHGNHPLFDTGQLARSIQCQLVKKS